MINVEDLIKEPDTVKTFTKLNRSYIKCDPEGMSWASDLATRLGFDLGEKRIVVIHIIYVHIKALGDKNGR